MQITAVGLAAVMAARVAGATTIIAVDLHESRLDLARELGATHVLNGADEDLAGQIRAISGYPLDQINQAEADAQSGKVVKPVLIP